MLLSFIFATLAGATPGPATAEPPALMIAAIRDEDLGFRRRAQEFAIGQIRRAIANHPGRATRLRKLLVKESAELREINALIVRRGENSFTTAERARALAEAAARVARAPGRSGDLTEAVVLADLHRVGDERVPTRERLELAAAYLDALDQIRDHVPFDRLTRAFATLERLTLAPGLDALAPRAQAVERGLRRAHPIGVWCGRALDAIGSPPLDAPRYF